MSDDEQRTRIAVEVATSDRADRLLLRAYPDASRRAVLALFEEGAVFCNGRRIKKGHRLGAGDELSLAREPHDAEALRAQPEDAPIEILFEDEALLVINKESGLPSHPLRAGELGCVANRAVFHAPELAQIGDDPREGGLVHRLDRYTSGVLVFAKTAAAWSALRQQFSDKTIQKSYLALVQERPIGSECELPLVQRGQRVRVDGSGLDAHTRWELVREGNGHFLMRCFAETGRMHQIRAHLSECGSPIVGDPLYGSEQTHADGYFLHAESLRLAHPSTGSELLIEAPLPAARELRLREALEPVAAL